MVSLFSKHRDQIKFGVLLVHVTANVENECGSRIKMYEMCRRYDDVVLPAVAGYKTLNEINTRIMAGQIGVSGEINEGMHQITGLDSSAGNNSWINIPIFNKTYAG